MSTRFVTGFWLHLLALSLLVASLPAQAHEIRPAYLQIVERTAQGYDLLWKIPTSNDTVPDIRPSFDAGFTLTPQPGQTVVDGFAIFRYQLQGERGLPGTTLAIHNLENTTVDTLVSIALADGSQHRFLLRPREPRMQVPELPTTAQVVRNYTLVGVEHILSGWDHLAFVAALMLIVSGWPMLLKTVTAFTLAHSITLGLATFGYVSLAPPPVETLIAISIVLVAAEAIRLRRGQRTLATRWPWLVAFVFGLLHGFGFAGALTAIGLPQNDIPMALLFFNLGVELGQLLFIAVLLAGLAGLRRLVQLPRAAPIGAAYGVGALAMFWVIERLNGMFY